MPDELQIENVAISPPRTVRNPEAIGGEEQWIDVAITVRNTSDTTQYVIASPRFLRYDPDTRTLHVGFFQPPSSPQAVSRHFFAPPTIEVTPGDTQVINGSVPVNIKQIQFSPERGIKVQAHNLEDVQHVTASVAYNHTPPPYEPTTPSQEARQRVADWGQRVEVTVAP